MTERLSPGAEHAPAIFIRSHDVVQQCFADPGKPELLVAQRALFQQAIDWARAQHIDDRARMVIDAFGRVVDYLWYQPATATPPDDIVYQQTEDEDGPRWGSFEFGKEHLGVQMFMGVNQVARQYGLNHIVEARERCLERNRDLLHAAVRDTIASTNAAQWLQSFALDSMTGQRRLTPAQRALHEARIFSEATQPLAESLGGGTLPRSILNTRPDIIRKNVRGIQALDDMPGKRIINRPDPRQLPTELANVAITRLLQEYDTDNALHVVYDSNLRQVQLFREDGSPIEINDSTNITVNEIAVLLQQDTDRQAHFGIESMGLQFMSRALEIAFDVTVGRRAGGHAYADAIEEAAREYSKMVVRGFGLYSSGAFVGTLDFMKLPPTSSLGTSEFGDVDELDEERVDFNLPDLWLPPEAHSAQLVFEAGLDEFMQRNRDPRPILRTRARKAYERLLVDLRRHYSLPEDADNDALFGLIRQTSSSQSDLVPDCLHAIGQAMDELSGKRPAAEPRYRGQPLSRATCAELGRILDYIGAYRKLNGQDDPRDPNGYGLQPHLLDALSRALEPFGHLAEPNRRFPD